MREIHVDEIRDNVAQICLDAAYNLSEDVLTAFDRAIETETAPGAKEIIELLKENARIAREEHIPICQDTGIAVFFVEIGQDLRIKNGFIVDAINEGVRKGYREGYLRKSVVDPITRKNTGDNTPAIIHYNIVPGDKLKISFGAKGGGSENMSRLAMLKPSQGEEGVKDFVSATAAKNFAVRLDFGGQGGLDPHDELLPAPGPQDGDRARLETDGAPAVCRLHIGDAGLIAHRQDLLGDHQPARVEVDPLPFSVDVDLGEYEVASAAEALSSGRAEDVASLVEALASSSRGSSTGRRLRVSGCSSGRPTARTASPWTRRASCTSPSASCPTTSRSG